MYKRANMHYTRISKKSRTLEIERVKKKLYMCECVNVLRAQSHTCLFACLNDFYVLIITLWFGTLMHYNILFRKAITDTIRFGVFHFHFHLNIEFYVPCTNTTGEKNAFPLLLYSLFCYKSTMLLYLYEKLNKSSNID